MIELLTVILAPLLFMPTMTAYYAYSHGRSFWRWFLIGFGLPYGSLLLVAWVVHRDQRRQRQVVHPAPLAGEELPPPPH